MLHAAEIKHKLLEDHKTFLKENKRLLGEKALHQQTKSDKNNTVQ